MSNVAIRKILIVSTSHISPQTRDWLDQESQKVMDLHRSAFEASLNRPFPQFPIYPSVYGWMLFADEDPLDHWPDEIRKLMQLARESNADWVELDCDGDVIEGLPTWNW